MRCKARKYTQHTHTHMARNKLLLYYAAQFGRWLRSVVVFTPPRHCAGLNKRRAYSGVGFAASGTGSCLPSELPNAYDQSWRQTKFGSRKKKRWQLLCWLLKKRNLKSHDITSYYSRTLFFPARFVVDLLVPCARLRPLSVEFRKIYAQFMRNAKRHKNQKSKTNICASSRARRCGGKGTAIPWTQWRQRNSNTNIGNLLYTDKLTRCPQMLVNEAASYSSAFTLGPGTASP